MTRRPNAIRPTRHAVTIHLSPEHMDILIKNAAADRRNVKNYAEHLVIKTLESSNDQEN